MSEKCVEGLENRCPKLKTCISDYGNMTILEGYGEREFDPVKLKMFAKEVKIGTKCWSDDLGLYVCSSFKENAKRR